MKDHNIKEHLVFMKKWLLEIHKRDASEYVRNRCDKVWFNSRDLQKHRHSVHGVSLNAVTEKFQCDNCGQELSRKVMLERHQRVCIACDKCDAVCCNHRLLKKHNCNELKDKETNNDGEQSDAYQCKICGH